MSITGTHVDLDVEKIDNTRLVDRYRKDRGKFLRITKQINRVRKSARHRKYEWQLTNLQAAEILVKDCVYCGQQSSHLIDLTSENPYNGIDRQDNALGYTLANSVPCCRHCNRAKMEMNLDEFKKWITKIYKHLIK